MAAEKTGKKREKVKATGETGMRLETVRDSRDRSAYTLWKRRLPFGWRKALILTELALFITLGVVIAQILEVAGVIRWLACITRPVLWLGDLPEEAGPALIVSLQSGAIANSMLVGYRDEGELSNRQLYTSVFVVSCLSLFAHLPTFIVPLAAAFGWEATIALFSVRFGAIFVEILLILLVSRFLIRPWFGDTKSVREVEEKEEPKKRGEKDKDLTFWQKVWKRSRRTLFRLLICLVPSFALMAWLEYSGAFKSLSQSMPGLFSYEFLPAQAPAIVAGQAVNLYNGAILAANFVDEGAITVKQAIIVLLFGSLVTAPIRTLKHALPTYLAVLGPRAGFVMAVSAQVLRCLFVLAGLILLMHIW